ncbi:MAG TPA: hypothetical protein DIT50_03365 [Rhodocyclaceae bacterium]|nr:hypothetical protein [Rhodocyclaceae bacterium]
MPQLRLTAAWAEIDRQAAVLKAALADWSALPACERQPEVVESDAQRLRLLDQILFRFLNGKQPSPPPMRCLRFWPTGGRNFPLRRRNR